MTEPTPPTQPFAALPPIQIPPGHPIADPSGFEDVAAAAKALADMGGLTPAQADAAMTEPTLNPDGSYAHHFGPPPPTSLPALIATAIAAGITPDEINAMAAQAAETRRLAAARPVDAPQPCHRCGNPATAQWPRHATPDEHEQHWAALEQNIRASNDGRPEAEYVADRSDSVVKAVFGCDEHQVDDVAMVHDADCGGHGACRCGGEA